MRASGTFKAANFTPAPVPSPEVETALPVGVATMEKRYEGEVTGRSVTLFTFAHSASTLGDSTEAEFFVIVAASGTGALAGITGTGGLAVDPDGTHRVWFDYELGA